MVLNDNVKPFSAPLEGWLTLCSALLKDKLWETLFQNLNVTKLLCTRTGSSIQNVQTLTVWTRFEYRCPSETLYVYISSFCHEPLLVDTLYVRQWVSQKTKQIWTSEVS